MKTNKLSTPEPANDLAVKILEEALFKAAGKAILLEINNAIYQLSREGQWFKFSLLTKKRTVKRSAIFETLTELYNQAMHGTNWKIASCGI